ncbi:acetyl-CoA carboxylase biotin carboxyl carrier protein [Candidatus Poribacteria bacterium]|nr:acetyl-CoA carboxylase biotin carboxyl carrier protein [Candidatus Poribacteria bacterium]
MRECGLSELAVEEGKESRRLLLRLQGAVAAPAPVQPMAAPAVPVVERTPTEIGGGNFDVVEAPMIGTFYIAPSPSEPPFVAVGDRVTIGKTLCIIEAMKLLNQIEAEFECEIIEVLVANATPVEYGQPLFRVRRV